MAHAHAGAGPRSVACAVLTVSDTRGPGDDAGGDAVQEALAHGGHRVVMRAYARDDVAEIRAAVEALLAGAAAAVVVTGGTGIAPRDVTPEALGPLVDKPMPGFGESFRRRSEAEVGGAAWLSRAGAGIARGKVLAWLPGSPAGAAMGTRLLVAELPHLAALLERHRRA